MPLPAAYKFDPITAGWNYIRPALSEVAKGVTWRKEPDRTDDPHRIVIPSEYREPRGRQLVSWVDFCYAIKKRGVTIFA